MKTKSLLGLVLLILALPATAGDRGADFLNLDSMIEELNLRPYFASDLSAPKRQLKVAVFDNGFRGAAENLGVFLPDDTQIHPGPVALPGEPGDEEEHGYYMARIFWSLVSLGGTDERYRPELHLYNTYGYTNLKTAVDDAIDRGIDVILYSQTWEYGGNFDGRGFINVQVDRAIDAGILWINNSGNFGRATVNARVESGSDDWIELPGRNDSVEVRCEENPEGKCQLRSVLSWNSFSDDVEEGTDKDLDFVLADDTLNILQSSNLTQKKNAGSQPGVSKYPREILTAELQPGLYFLRVKNRSKNFGAKDRLRITVGGEFLTLNMPDREENLLPPADNPRAITVGALDSERSSVSRRLKKPELFTNSLVTLTEEENFKGSSNSAARVAAGAAILLARNPGLTRAKLLRLTGMEGGDFSGGGDAAGVGLPLDQLGFLPSGRNGCFKPVDSLGVFPRFIQFGLENGGTLVQTANAGWKMFFPFDPIRLLPGVERFEANDILVMSDTGPGIYSRSGLFQLPSNMIELVQIPAGHGICGQPRPAPLEPGTFPTWGRVFRLPNP